MLGDALTAAVLFEAIQVSALDFIFGLGVALVLGTIALIVSAARQADRELRQEVDAMEQDLDDAWASLPPKWSPPRAESDLGDVSERRAA